MEERTKVGEGPLLCVVDLCAFDNDGMRWQVDAPCQRRRATQHLISQA